MTPLYRITRGPGVRGPRRTMPMLLGVIALTIATGSGAQDAPVKRLRASDVDTMPVREKGARLQYGADSLQFGELRLPPGNGPFPVAIVIHGGCWYTPYASLRNTAPLAQALTDAGIATWNIEYRRYDSPGGGWPNTFLDVALATDYVRKLTSTFPFDTTRIAAIGHSAGGQLALWLASRKSGVRHKELTTSRPLPLAAVVALGPVTDMREFYAREKQTCGNPAIETVLGGMPDQVPERLQAVSPLELLPLRVPTVLIAGDKDFIAPRPVLDAYAAAARAKGDSVVIVTTMGEGHFESIAPTREAGKAAIDAIKRLLARRP